MLINKLVTHTYNRKNSKSKTNEWCAWEVARIYVNLLEESRRENGSIYRYDPTAQTI